jgi:23S rRNA (adenine2503-C2)-methyltransferase
MNIDKTERDKHMQWFFDLSKTELKELIAGLGLEGYVSEQLSFWLLRKNIQDSEKWSNISKTNRELLIKNIDFQTGFIVRKDRDSAGTVKYLIELKDGIRIESVLMKEKGYHTFCISSQAGCALACKFCATGNRGFKRDLSSGEIVMQYVILKRELGDYNGKINLVFMGMGEPLLNYDNVKKAIIRLTEEKGAAVSPKRITVSTAGILKNLKRLEDDFPDVRISFSLNAPDNEKRLKLMPISKTEKLDEIIDYFRNRKRRYPVTFEYVLISGVNDSIKDAEKVSKRIKGISAKINLIPCNPNDFMDFSSPVESEVNAFGKYLAQKGYTVMVRWSKGRDIRSACGQLAGE